MSVVDRLSGSHRLRVKKSRSLIHVWMKSALTSGVFVGEMKCGREKFRMGNVAGATLQSAARQARLV